MLAPKLGAELIGTFFLVFTVGMTVMGPDASPLMAPLAIGVALMIGVYATGHVSGGHLNPAVTLGVCLRGKCPWSNAGPYMIAQIVGGLLAAAAVALIKHTATGDASAAAPASAHYTVLAKILVEFLFTFALVYVVLNTATAKGTAGNSFYGLAIGFVVVAGAYAAGPVSGAAFNPAVAVGVGAMGLASMTDVLILIAADMVGGLAAAIVFVVFGMGGDQVPVSTPADLAASLASDEPRPRAQGL